MPVPGENADARSDGRGRLPDCCQGTCGRLLKRYQKDRRAEADGADTKNMLWSCCLRQLHPAACGRVVLCRRQSGAREWGTGLGPSHVLIPVFLYNSKVWPRLRHHLFLQYSILTSRNIQQTGINYMPRLSLGLSIISPASVNEPFSSCSAPFVTSTGSSLPGSGPDPPHFPDVRPWTTPPGSPGPKKPTYEKHGYFRTCAGAHACDHDRRDQVCKVLEGVFQNEELLGIICTIDKDDDWTDFENWKKANPNFGVSIHEIFSRTALITVPRLSLGLSIISPASVNESFSSCSPPFVTSIGLSLPGPDRYSLQSA